MDNHSNFRPGQRRSSGVAMPRAHSSSNDADQEVVRDRDSGAHSEQPEYAQREEHIPGEHDRVRKEDFDSDKDTANVASGSVSGSNRPANSVTMADELTQTPVLDQDGNPTGRYHYHVGGNGSFRFGEAIYRESDGNVVVRPPGIYRLPENYFEDRDIDLDDMRTVQDDMNRVRDDMRTVRDSLRRADYDNMIADRDDLTLRRNQNTHFPTGGIWGDTDQHHTTQAPPHHARSTIVTNPRQWRQFTPFNDEGMYMDEAEEERDQHRGFTMNVSGSRHRYGTIRATDQAQVTIGDIEVVRTSGSVDERRAPGPRLPHRH